MFALLLHRVSNSSISLLILLILRYLEYRQPDVSVIPLSHRVFQGAIDDSSILKAANLLRSYLVIMHSTLFSYYLERRTEESALEGREIRTGLRHLLSPNGLMMNACAYTFLDDFRHLRFNL